MPDERHEILPVHESGFVHAPPRRHQPFDELGEQGTFQRVAEGNVDAFFRDVVQRGHEQRVVSDDHGPVLLPVGMIFQLLFQFEQLGMTVVSRMKMNDRFVVSAFPEYFAPGLPAGEPFLVFRAAPVTATGENAGIGVQAYLCPVFPQVSEKAVFRTGESDESGKDHALALKFQRQIWRGSGELRRMLKVHARRAQAAGA